LGRSIAGLRRSPLVELTPEQIATLTREFEEVGGDPAMLRFNDGSRTAYQQGSGVASITVRGDVLPATWETHPRSTMSSREVLAFRGTTNRRCLRCGGELRMIESGSGLQIRCEREQRVILTARA